MFSCITSVSFGDVVWQVEGVSYIDPTLKIDRSEEQSACKDASDETELDKQPSAFKSNEPEANQDDESGLVDNTNQGANITVRLSLYF